MWLPFRGLGLRGWGGGGQAWGQMWITCFKVCCVCPNLGPPTLEQTGTGNARALGPSAGSWPGGSLHPCRRGLAARRSGLHSSHSPQPPLTPIRVYCYCRQRSLLGGCGGVWGEVVGGALRSMGFVVLFPPGCMSACVCRGPVRSFGPIES